jgi:hypothetical protein
MIKRLSSAVLGVAVLSCLSLQVPAQDAGGKCMREYKGVKLGMKTDDVHAALGKPETTGENQEEYKIGADDLMTVHYDSGVVKSIQLYFADKTHAPAFKDVVGDVEITQTDTGARRARRDMTSEKFWVSMFQNKDASVTTVTISRR